jgi:putrescine transport system permease protein
MQKISRFGISSLFFGYLFLYAPIVYMVIFSFNQSIIPGVWKEFSWRWYETMLQNESLLQALLTSLKIASFAATGAVVLGTMGAVIMVRYGKFRGRTLFSGLISAPLVMPEVITGLSLLLMFVTFERIIGWPSERGVMTVVIAHMTIGTAYVYLIVQSRLRDFERSLEEAALDLGAPPATVFFKITLPIIAPSLLSGWLLSFALSLDDVVIASFLSGPGATTLPILIFSSVRMGITPEINALAGFIVAFISIFVVIAGFVISRKQKYAR